MLHRSLVTRVRPTRDSCDHERLRRHRPLLPVLLVQLLWAVAVQGRWVRSSFPLQQQRRDVLVENATLVEDCLHCF